MKLLCLCMENGLQHKRLTFKMTTPDLATTTLVQINIHTNVC